MAAFCLFSYSFDVIKIFIPATYNFQKIKKKGFLKINHQIHKRQTKAPGISPLYDKLFLTEVFSLTIRFTYKMEQQLPNLRNSHTHTQINK